MFLLRPEVNNVYKAESARNSRGWSVHDERGGKVSEFGAGERSLLKHSRKPYRAEDLGKAWSRRFERNYNSQDSEDIVQILKGWELLAKEPDSLCEVLTTGQTPNE